MDDVTRHPDDEQLFDLVDGALDDAATERVQRHIARCAACAAFVRSATEGAAALDEPVQPMPAAAAEAMHMAIDAEWRARRAVTEPEPAPEPDPDPVPMFAPVPTLEQPRPTRRRARRLLPVLAFAVLATLAGTSVYVGQQSGSDSSSSDAKSTESTTSVSEALSSASGAGLETAARAADSAATAAPVDPSVQLDQGIELDRICIATLDETALYLPDGRIPQQVLRGPLGIYVVCG